MPVHAGFVSHMDQPVVQHRSDMAKLALLAFSLKGFVTLVATPVAEVFVKIAVGHCDIEVCIYDRDRERHLIKQFLLRDPANIEFGFA